MRLHLIRHGQTQSNVDRLLDTAHPGAPLTEEGHAQAAALVDVLADEPLDAIFASTLTRAQETAAPLAKARGLEVKTLEGVQEIAAGVEEMSADWTVYVGELNSWSAENMDSKLEGGESAREFIERYDDALRTLEQAGLENVAVVSHGAAMRVWGITQLAAEHHRLASPLANTEWITLVGSPTEGWTVESWGRTRF